MNLLPEFRKASKLDGSRDVLFATVDCAANTRLCEQYGVRSYPTTILFNGTEPNNYYGIHRAQDISDFIEVSLYKKKRRRKKHLCQIPIAQQFYYYEFYFIKKLN